MTSSPIKVGFVGLSSQGWAASGLGLSLSKSSKFHLVAVSTTSPESARASAEAQSKLVGHKVKAYHGSSKAIANDPEVDFVAVAVKAPYHREVLLPVVEAGKNFFIEWPAGNGLQESAELSQLAAEKNLRTVVGLQGRHSPYIRKVSTID
jgi:predicted dehydrogenase